MKNKVLLAEQERERYHAIRHEILELLGGACKRCGIADMRVLQVSYVEGGGNKARGAKKSMTSQYRRILKEIREGSKTYEALCANCVQIKNSVRTERI